MKLLIITQAIDENDPVLSFFTNWVRNFATRFEKVTVICLKKGLYNLPSNVSVFSLGKERKYDRRPKVLKRLSYVFTFLKLIISRRGEYDRVFVHMNQEYVLLGGFWWKMFGKKVFLWRNHNVGDINTDIAISLSDKVFSTSKFSYTKKSPKNVLMPVGIDTDLFNFDPNIKRKENSILFLGRIAPVKRLDFILKAIFLLNQKGIDFVFNIYGDPKFEDEAYYDYLKKYVLDNSLEKKVSFFDGVSNDKASKIYSENEIFINMTNSGAYDKTIFEAMASHMIVLTSNKNLENKLDKNFILKEDDARDVASKIERVLKLSKTEKDQIGLTLRDLVLKEHSLNILSGQLFFEICK